MTWTLFHSPGACSLSSHIALEESGLPYTPKRITLRKGEGRLPEYLAVNPRGSVPALLIDESGDGRERQLVTECVAILQLVADSAPERALVPPPGTVARARATEWMAYLSSTVHIAFRQVFRPERFTPDAAAHEAIRAGGRVLLDSIFRDIEARLEGRTYALGDRFSLVDANLFVFHAWSRREAAAPSIPKTPWLDAIAARVAERPAVRTVLAREAADAG